MLKVISYLRDKARQNTAKIVLPEGEDKRVLAAADFIVRGKLAEIILLGNKDIIVTKAKEEGLKLDGVDLVDPSSSEYLNGFCQLLYNKRKHKGMTEEQAKKLLIEKPVYFAGMLVKEHKADGFVAGAVHTTRDVARAGLYCVGTDPDVGTMSSSFIMVLDDESFGERGVLIFADCAIVPVPSAEQLSNIAIAASDLMNVMFSVAPRVALLSFSTKGSGTTEDTKRLVKAVDIVKQSRPDILIDGELQGDASLIPEVAKRKAPNSPIEGRANVLIFPNLEAGNIAYKLTQRLA